ncbi:MAG: cyclase family protein [Pseudomonadales bacterium]|nr:cyclase family protein [Pseudomonadales bacterium]MCP5172142.1 cyclase family protein [Pseudomonadales bacterium]
MKQEQLGVNWGKWGEDDERGAANRVTPLATKRGIAASISGEVLSLAVPLSSSGPAFGMRSKPQHYMTRDGGDYAAGHKEKGFGFADDVIMLPTHGTTHMDALSHIWAGGRMWNGYSSNTVTSKGAKKCGIDKMGPIVTRGLFLDFAGPDGVSQSDDHSISLDELKAEFARRELHAEEGDALLIRTGWLKRWREGEATVQKWAGLNPECAQWIDEQGFALIGADNIAVEFGPSPLKCNAAPMHVELMRNRGVVFMELLDFEQLATTGRSEFMFVVSPLPIVGGVGSPINPVVVL